jgi:Type II secretion system (T2SS), protein M subtype b
MNASLPKPIRQVAAVALLVAIVAGVAQLLVVPVFDHVLMLRARIDQERLVLAHLSSIRSNDATFKEVEQLGNAAGASRLSLDGESDAIRMANLQSLLGGIATVSGVKMRSVRNLPARERHEVRLLGLQLQFAATIEQLQRIIVAIERHRPYLLIETLQITPLQAFLATGAENTGMLETRLEVLGATAREKG